MRAKPPTREERLARIESEIARYRLLYLQATWKGHDGEALFYEGEIDRLLDEFSTVRAGQPAHH